MNGMNNNTGGKEKKSFEESMVHKMSKGERILTDTTSEYHVTELTGSTISNSFFKVNLYETVNSTKESSDTTESNKSSRSTIKRTEA